VHGTDGSRRLTNNGLIRNEQQLDMSQERAI
jgi:hypothetical protein